MLVADKLELILLNYDPHVTIITETWLTGEINDSEVIPSSHKIFRRDRSSQGSVAIVLKSTIDAVLLNQIDDHESLFLRANVCVSSVILCAVYRPPSSPPDLLFRLYDHLLRFQSNNVILSGDFHLPEINWTSFPLIML